MLAFPSVFFKELAAQILPIIRWQKVFCDRVCITLSQWGLLSFQILVPIELWFIAGFRFRLEIHAALVECNLIYLIVCLVALFSGGWRAIFQIVIEFLRLSWRLVREGKGGGKQHHIRYFILQLRSQLCHF